MSALVAKPLHDGVVVVAFVILGVLVALLLVLVVFQVRAMLALRDEARRTGGKVAPIRNNLVTFLRGDHTRD